MKMVQGFRGGLPVLGVRAPVLPSVVDLTSSPPAFDASAPTSADDSWGIGETVELAASGVPAPASLAAFSFSARSFCEALLSLRLFLSFSKGVEPLAFAETAGLAGVSVPDAAAGGGVDVADLFARCGGTARS